MSLIPVPKSEYFKTVKIVVVIWELYSSIQHGRLIRKLGQSMVTKTLLSWGVGWRIGGGGGGDERGEE